jgi:hypothetical protein
LFHLKKEFNKSSLVLYLGFILVTWSLLQISLQTFFENNDNILMKIPSIYAKDDGGVNGNGVRDGNGGVFDNGDSDVEELTLEDSQDEYVDVSIFGGGAPSGTNINSQLPPGDPLSLLFVSLPLPPAGPLPPGGLPPLPGSPLPPGSPIQPGGGPTPPEELPPLARDLPADEVHHDDDDDENKEKYDEKKEKEDGDDDNDDKDNN